MLESLLAFLLAWLPHDEIDVGSLEDEDGAKNQRCVSIIKE